MQRPLAWPALHLVMLALCLGGCGGVKVRPEQQLPRALLQPMNVSAGLVLDDELRGYRHEETRGSADWAVELGAGHERLFQYIFAASFSDLRVFRNLDAAQREAGLHALFQPQIEQYSFATARETSGAYWAVTIRYRIGVLTPQGEPVEALTLTGYGSARDAGGSGQSLAAATRAAMRDAAAKFLVQLPRQPVAMKLAAGQILTAADHAVVAVEVIEAVPIEPVPPAG